MNTAQKEILYHKITGISRMPLRTRSSPFGAFLQTANRRHSRGARIVLIDRLLAAKAGVRVHDPVAQENVRALYGERLTYRAHHYDALEGADALAIVTEWNEFRNPDFTYLRHQMKQPVIFDGRNLFDPAGMRDLGFVYSGIGRHS